MHAIGIVVVGVEGHLFSVNLMESEFGDRRVDIDAVVYPTEVAGDASTGGVQDGEWYGVTFSVSKTALL